MKVKKITILGLMSFILTVTLFCSKIKEERNFKTDQQCLFYHIHHIQMDSRQKGECSQYNVTADSNVKQHLLKAKQDNFTETSHWSNAGGPYGITDCYALVVEPKNGNLLLAGSYNGMAKSTNGGNSWELIEQIKDNIMVVVFHPLDNSKIYAGGYKTFYISNNLGEDWTVIPVNTGVCCMAISPANPHLIFIGSNSWGRIGRSKDGGYNWEYRYIDLTRVYCMGIHPKNPQKIFIAGENGLLYSNDGGEEFVKIKNGLPENDSFNIMELLFHPENPDQMLLVGYLLFKRSGISKL